MSPNTTIPFLSIQSEPVEAERQQETNQTTSMENRQNAEQPEVILKLNYSTREKLIISLIQLSTILEISKPIPEDAKKRTCKIIDESIRLLVELSPFESTSSRQLVFELSRPESSKIMNHLVIIRDAVQIGRLITGPKRSGLVAENKRIINQLMDLAGRGLNGESDEEENGNQDESSVEKGMCDIVGFS